ncbi:MAG: copper resistance protein NlpE [Rikenellaceae bacterium]|jgi:hypothetical protein|nr:copper resistance protein NlpE [Rikenellaceae bacterium]
MKRWIIPVLLAALTAGCGNRAEKKATTDVLPDSLRIFTVVDSLAINPDLGELQKIRYVGLIPAADCPGIRYDLTLWNQAFSGDGVYALVMTYIESDDGRDISFYYSGRWGTLRGDVDDPDASICQLYDNERSQDTYLLRRGTDSLTLLTNDRQRIDSPLNYTITRVK